MKLRRSSKSLRSKPTHSTINPPSDDMLFSPGELKQMHHDGKRSKILKIATVCLLVAIIGTVVYAGSVWYEQYNKTTVLKAATAKHQAELQQLQQLQQDAAAQKQKQCQSADQKLVTDQQKLTTDQISLSSVQQQYASDQQELASAEQQLSTEGPLLIPYTQKLIQAIQKDISATQSDIASFSNLISADQQLVKQDQDFRPQLGCH